MDNHIHCPTCGEPILIPVSGPTVHDNCMGPKVLIDPKLIIKTTNESK